MAALGFVFVYLFPEGAHGVGMRTRLKGWAEDVQEEIGFHLSDSIHFQRESRCKTRE